MSLRRLYGESSTCSFFSDFYGGCATSAWWVNPYQSSISNTYPTSPGIKYDQPCRIITLNSIFLKYAYSWGAVGGIRRSRLPVTFSDFPRSLLKWRASSERKRWQPRRTWLSRPPRRRRTLSLRRDQKTSALVRNIKGVILIFCDNCGVVPRVYV